MSIEDQANENPNMFMMLNPPPVFYDEVQRAPGLFRFIKIKCDESDERGQFCLSGSQPLELMEKASESLSGRVSVIELAGLSLREIQGTPFNEPFVPTMDYVQKRSSLAKAPDNLWAVIHRAAESGNGMVGILLQLCEDLPGTRRPQAVRRTGSG